MIYIGDSSTDIPCMRLIQKSGGNAIGVYDKNTVVNIEENKKYSHLFIGKYLDLIEIIKKENQI